MISCQGPETLKPAAERAAMGAWRRSDRRRFGIPQPYQQVIDGLQKLNSRMPVEKSLRGNRTIPLRTRWTMDWDAPRGRQRAVVISCASRVTNRVLAPPPAIRRGPPAGEGSAPLLRCAADR